MPTGSVSKEEAVHRALAQLGGASDEELIHFVQREYGLAVAPRFLPVLRAKQITEQARAKAREATPPTTSEVTGSQCSASESLPPDSRE